MNLKQERALKSRTASHLKRQHWRDIHQEFYGEYDKVKDEEETLNDVCKRLKEKRESRHDENRNKK